ncbi:MAG: phosphoribosyl-AMP cyclohydrolase [Verrucomicrobiales bacterium]|jgi:phosphoribosyl-AMP cyclohydrolase|nr:phosphoribosyl-AMP cyclohydrolase [Verrucomicrobiales bacterium]
MTDWQNIFAARGDKKQLEDGTLLAPKFDQNGLIPAIATDYDSGEALMFAYMNREALALTIKLGEAVYWSRSRQEIWHKGATSGNVQVVRELRIDCDQDAIWLRVTQKGFGSACHTGYRSCFYRAIPTGAAAAGGVQLVFKETEKLFDPGTVYGKK